jgi:ABC-type glycerol-3-phosphate transport system substrate-binding protein
MTKQRSILFISLVVILLLLAACQPQLPAPGGEAAQPTEEQAATDASAEPAEPTEKTPITIFRGGVQIDWDADPVVLAIEDKMNVDIKFLTSDWSEIPQVRNLALSTGEDVDIYHHMDTNPQWIEDGAIIPIDEYVNPNDHPYLHALINSPLFEPMKRDGKTYYISMLSDGSDWVWLVRKDWMEELGLEMPTNEVEFREMLQAFKDRDPEGRTVGLQVEGGQTIRRSMVPVLAIFGAPTNFPNPERVYTVDGEGKLVPMITSENAKAALQFMNGLYADGLINTDFPTLSSFPQLSEKYIQAGKAGVSWFPNGGNFPIPDSETAFIPAFSATGFEHARSQGIPTQGWISISSTAKDPQKAIDLLEYFVSREGRELLVMGVEGLHWQNLDENGKFERIKENWPYTPVYYPLHFYLGNGTMKGYVPVGEFGSVEEALANADVWEPTEGGVGIAETMAASAQWTGAPMMFQYVEFPELADMLTAINDAVITGWTEIITAPPESFEAEWEEYLAELEAAGLAEWTQAYQDYYDENLK